MGHKMVAQERLNLVAEKLWIWFAWRLPHELVRWAYIRLAAHATQGQYSNTVVPEVTMMDALDRWDR